MAIFLCALMLLGTFAAVIPYLGMGAYAADSTSATAASTENTLETIRTGTELVRIGLMYGTGVTVGFEVRADHGMYFGHVIENKFTPIWQTELTLVSATSDANLAKSAMTYSITSSPDAKVGGWHIECDANVDAFGLNDFYANVNAIAAQFGINAFPAYIDGRYVVRIGTFTTESQAQMLYAALMPMLGNMLKLSIVGPSDSGVSVIDPNTDVILFEYDSDDSELGITPVQAGDTPTYLVTPAKNQYEGIFEFSRYRSGSTDGVALTNILTLDQYVAGVLPYEISNTWPEEVQKAFAVTVRTFTLSMYGRHTETYGFDMCNSTHCQAYMGCKRADTAVRKAVAATSHQVLTYKGELAKTFYSAVTGGVTVDIRDAWGGNVEYPYLVAVSTPWENYSGHKNGSWTAEVTPSQLGETLRAKGYNVRGSIIDVKINSFARNSSYVNSISFTDSYGNTVTIKTTDKIRTVLSAYLNSSNFVVARGGQTVTVNNYKLATDVPILPPSSSDSAAPTSPETVLPDSGNSGISIITAYGLVSYTPGESVTYTKDIGSEHTTNLSSLTVMTANGPFAYDMTSEYNTISTEQTYTPIPQPEANITQWVQGSDQLPSLLDILSYKTVITEETVTAPGSPSNFVFIGRGWGHGVGLSQYGALNLAQLGYDARSILAAYFPGTDITVLP